MKGLAEQHNLPVENLLTPDYVRRLMWEPPFLEAADGSLEELVAARLGELGARPWQVELTCDVLAQAIRSPGPVTDPTGPVRPPVDGA